MYKRITLEKFGRGEFYRLADFESENIRKEIEYTIGVINDGIAEGYDYFDMFMETYENKLVGIMSVCSMIGIVVQIERVKADEIETKGDEVGTNVNN